MNLSIHDLTFWVFLLSLSLLGHTISVNGISIVHISLQDMRPNRNCGGLHVTCFLLMSDCPNMHECKFNALLSIYNQAIVLANV